MPKDNSPNNTAKMSRAALITGATAGMGLEIARELAAHGLKVIVGARDIERGHAVAAELCAAGGNVVPVQLDVTDPVTVSTRQRG